VIAVIGPAFRALPMTLASRGDDLPPPAATALG